MTIEQIVGGSVSVIGLLSIIQVSPVKLNPWNPLLKLLKIIAAGIGRSINADQLKKLDVMSTDIRVMRRDINNLQQQQNADREHSDRSDIEQTRRRIISGADEIRHNVHHSEEWFNQMLEDITAYETYCEKHPTYPNRKAVTSIELIEQTYKSRMENNDFL